MTLRELVEAVGVWLGATTVAVALGLLIKVIGH